MSEDHATAPLTDAIPEDDARRTLILSRYGSARAALLPCPYEIALRDATWGHVVPGDPSTGPSLMGWREGPAAAMQPHVRSDVAAAFRMPATPADAWAERRHWEHRAEVHQVLGGGGLPLWVRARRAVLDAHLDAMFLALPDEAACEEWRRLAGEDPDIEEPPAVPVARDQGEAEASPESGNDPSGGRADGSPDPGGPPEQPARTRAEAREAVRALLIEGLTDREIARRIGVSPSTVGAVRKAVAGELPDEGSR